MVEETKKEDEIIEERKKKLRDFFIKNGWWVIFVLIATLILGIYLRSLPMSNHSGGIPSIWSFIFHGDSFYGGKPGLWDITTNDWTLGPDLDPFLFLRYAKEMINGGLPPVDTIRYVPVGFDTAIELQMVSYMIVLTHKVINFFGYNNINLAAALMPVILFALTIIAFFLFVREIFARKNAEDKNLKANIVAWMSTLFMTVIPVFLSRTVAGIPEKESVAFFFMFLSFFLFLKAWKSEKIKLSAIWSFFAGISTALMGLTWGGVSYVYITIAVAGLSAFVLGKVEKKEFLIYSLWFFVSLVITLMFTKRFSLGGFLTSLDTGMVFLVILLALLHFVVWNTRIKNVKILRESKLPKSVITLIIIILITIVIAVIASFLGSSLFIDKITAINQMTFKPVTGRWSQTVAENRQPYFTEWGYSFGPFIKGIPITFWLFFIGSVILFRQMLSHIKKRDAWILAALYVIFFCGLVFSRYAPHPSLMDGEGFASRLFYYGSAILLIAGLIHYYSKYHKENISGFEKIDFEYLFLFALFILCLFTARSAVRLIMVLGPVAPIFVGYLLVISASGFLNNRREENKKIFYAIISIIVLVLVLFSFWSFYKEIKSEAYSYIPSPYTQQWQKGMEWVRNNTPENAVFAHWWDYGYWVQSMGNRATVTDGGNIINFWNYWTGRLVLTGDNKKDALDFLYSHNATYLLIDSSDLGKYGAFSIIGSDANMDRFSPGPVTLVSNPQQARETRDGIARIYGGVSGIDEDINYEENGTKIFLPSGSAALVGITSESRQDNESVTFKQPQAVFYYNGNQVSIPLRYLYYNGGITDYKLGLNGTAYVIQSVYQTDKGLQIDNFGAIMYVSPRIMRGLLGQIYILDDPLKNFQNFNLVRSEPNIVISNLNSQGANLREFVEYAELNSDGSTRSHTTWGPIKIWEIRYTGQETFKPEYIDTDASKYISWQL